MKKWWIGVIVTLYACGFLGLLMIGFILFMAQQDPTQRNMKSVDVVIVIGVFTLLNFFNAVVRHRRYCALKRLGKEGGL